MAIRAGLASENTKRQTHGAFSLLEKRSALAVRHTLQNIGAPVELVNQNCGDVAGDQHPHQPLERPGMQFSCYSRAEIIGRNARQWQGKKQRVKGEMATFAAI